MTKFRGLNWNGQSLEDWIELWSNLEGVIYNLTNKKNLETSKSKTLDHHTIKVKHGPHGPHVHVSFPLTVS